MVFPPNIITSDSQHLTQKEEGEGEGGEGGKGGEEGEEGEVVGCNPSSAHCGNICIYNYPKNTEQLQPRSLSKYNLKFNAAQYPTKDQLRNTLC